MNQDKENAWKMKNGSEKRTNKTRLLVITAFLCFSVVGFYQSNAARADFGYETAAKEVTAAEPNDDAGAKYTSFPHRKHKQSCSTCHKFPTSNWKRVRNDPFPDIADFPRHESCLSCHRREFYGVARPQICSICHTKPSPNNSTRHAFQNTRSNSDFAIDFPHSTHIDVVAGRAVPAGQRPGDVSFVKADFRRSAEESCSVCHQTYKPQGDSDIEYFTPPPKDFDEGFWLKKGAFKTVPENHATCFTCHSTEVGITPAPSDCAVCHKPKPRSPATDFDAKTARPMGIRDAVVMEAWRGRFSSATFRHEFSSHTDMDCASCHNVTAMRTLNFATRKVDVMSCSMCHITETTDDGGILNYEVDERKANPAFQCVKCHISFGKLAIPASHLKAIVAQAGD